VVLKRDERQRHSPGGILIPDTAGQKPTEDRAMAFGKGKILESGKVHPWTSRWVIAALDRSDCRLPAHDRELDRNIVPCSV
jgi:hypothetical protein